MRRDAALALAASLSAVPLLSGCIAAAIPLAAGAAIARREAARQASGGVPAPVAPLVPAQSSVTGAAVESASASSDLSAIGTRLTALPPPDLPVGTGGVAVKAFRTYALRQTMGGAGGRERSSALLASPSDLRTARMPCGARPSAVFLDLDPGRGTFDPLAPGTADPALGAALTALRERGVAVIWFSRLGENFAGAIRAVLIQSGLDPAGGDELVLMRDIAERKQTRRDEAAKRVCPLAILGDERPDFDELYLYLKKPEAAVALDAMIGRGWFIASPFDQAASAPAGGARP